MNIKILILLLFNSIIINAQIKNAMEELKVTPEFEKFDTLYFEKIKQSKLTGWETLENGAYVYMVKAKGECSYSIVPKDSYFGLQKIYYPNGNIKSKGLGFVYSGFKKGQWYYFDESGNLLRSKDHDKSFKFTFEEVLKLAKKEGLIFMKTPIDNEYYSPYVPMLKRHYDDSVQKGFWEITWFNRNMGKIEAIQIDSDTGEILARDYGDFII